MRRASSLSGKLQILVFFLAALLVVTADQLSKIWVRTHLEVGQSIPEHGLLRLTHVRNTGAAFGLFQDQSFLLTIVALVGIAAILLCALLLYRRFPLPNNTLGRVLLGLVLGGTIGNLIDRLRFGYITDFIDFGIWPVFNAADSAIVVGAIIFACSLLVLARADRHETMRTGKV